MIERVDDCRGADLVRAIVQVIRDNRQYLSDIDGLIGDGDHGVNMSKGFTLAEERLTEEGFSSALETLGMTLLEDIGGSMGPLYSCIFFAMADSVGSDGIDKKVLGEMLDAAVRAVEEISPAKRGDKTLMDALIPARDAYHEAFERGDDFSTCIRVMGEAANEGRDATVNMVAKLGRASRLGERSRGVPDAGACSCALIINSIGSFLMASI